ncbi:MAG: HPr kinase [marine bacterium B5-7]|nr:MAG: HPr kinase [marine bacterium B5-7]
MSVLLGAIADDFTGASDLASTLVKGGMRTVQVIGVPADDNDMGNVMNNAEAVVVALKTRSTPVVDAVRESLAALNWLKGLGTEKFFFKYCSTFDSTSDGNIGPVADALLDALDDDLALICPAFPANKRSIYQGYLFVGDQLLEESSMRNHPLTPMRDSNLIRLMQAQSQRPVALVPYGVVRQGVDAVKTAFGDLKGRSGYAVVDAIDDADLSVIGRAAADHRLITGGSGVAIGVAENFRNSGRLTGTVTDFHSLPHGRSLVLAGSCSETTRGQIAHSMQHWPAYRIDTGSLLLDTADTTTAIEVAVEMALQQFDAAPPETPFLIYSSADPVEVERIQLALGRDAAGVLVESILAGIAREVLDRGVNRLVVAGGETSGAVVSALGIKALEIGAEIDPGVPWTRATIRSRKLGQVDIALALKSGNFGQVDFFERAFDQLAGYLG